MTDIRIGETDYTLPEGITVIGRSGDADIEIDSSKLSRTHVRFLIEGDSISIEDLGSKNGTFVNGDKITEKTKLKQVDGLLKSLRIFLLIQKLSLNCSKMRKLPTNLKKQNSQRFHWLQELKKDGLKL